ncbi:MAG TPA: hypothetical protein VIT21_11190 [Chthoniobacterales bacterium]
MKTDLIYSAVFCLAQLVLFSPLGSSLFPEFLASHNVIVWAIVSGIAFAAYPWLQSFLGPTALRLAPISARAAAIFILSTAVSSIIIGSTASDHFAEWQLGLFFIAVPSAATSIVALLISYGFFRLNRNA